jgi:hypothetical protein
MMQFDVVLRTFSDFFDREGIRYAVIGGVAATAWGRVRSTFDLDFAVRAEDSARIVAFAESLGYETLYISKAFSNHVHPDRNLGRVDFMYLRGMTAEDVLDATTLKPLIDDRDLPVAHPEHLAMMKALSMRNDTNRMRYEGEDVRVLLNVEGVNRDRVREYYRRLGLLEMFDAINKAR